MRRRHIGFTHYWYRNVQSKVSPLQWTAICEAFTKIYQDCSQNGIELLYEEDRPNSRPRCDGEVIRFNGTEKGNLGHETFILERITKGPVRDGEVFEFCKTARKPYDVAVTALLLAAEFYAPGVWRIESDGDREDWEEGVCLFEEIAGEDAPVLACWSDNS